MWNGWSSEARSVCGIEAIEFTMEEFEGVKLESVEEDVGRGVME